MLKSKSCSSGLTRATSASRQQSPMLKFDCKKITNVKIMTQAFNTTFTNPYPLKFPKKLVHKPTPMNMYEQTQQTNRKYCLKPNSNAHKASMLEQCRSKRQLKSGQFSHLACESPSKPIKQRQFQDIGTVSNRRRKNQNVYNSVSMLASITQNTQNIGPQKFVKAVEKKHFKGGDQFKKHLEWNDDKPNKQHFQAKYKRVGKEQLKKKQVNESNYSSIHLKYTIYK